MPGPRAETCLAGGGGDLWVVGRKPCPTCGSGQGPVGVRRAGCWAPEWAGPVCLPVPSALLAWQGSRGKQGVGRVGWSLPDVGDAPDPQDAQEFSDVERAIETLIKNFHQYSVEGGKETLTPSELQNLVTQQLPHLMRVLRGVTPHQAGP